MNRRSLTLFIPINQGQTHQINLLFLINIIVVKLISRKNIKLEIFKLKMHFNYCLQHGAHLNSPKVVNVQSWVTFFSFR